MKITLRADSVEIEGYVNSIERNSKPLMSRIGRFIERVCAGAFKKALNRAEDVKILLNHDPSRELGSIKKGNLELEEDNIGLKAKATITDPEVVKDAREGNLRGWSFGFYDRDVENSTEEGMPLRKIHDLDLIEVSLLNRKMTPAYAGTLVTVRCEDGKEDVQFRGEPMYDDDVEIDEEVVENSVENSEENERGTEESTEENQSQAQEEQPVEKPVEKTEEIDYTKFRDIIKDMKEV